MQPLTRDCPKPLLPVGPWTLVEHQLSALAAADVRRVVLSTGYRHADFAPLVERCRAKGVDLTTVVEAQPLGTGGGLREALRTLPGASEVVVLNGDLLTGHDLRAQIMSLQTAPQHMVASVHVREVEDARPYGSLVLDQATRVTSFVEKSEHPPSSTVNAGTYVVRAALLDLIRPSGSVSLEREVFPALAGRRVLLGHREDAYFLDVGSPAALVQANRDLLLAPWPGAAETPRGQALVLTGAEVADDAYLGGGTVIHPGVVIGPGARLESVVALPGAVIGARAVLRRAVIGREARVAEDSLVVDTALGTGEVHRT